MKKFQVFRYIRNLRIFIVIVTLVGSLGIYAYTNQAQNYSAETIIQFTNTMAKNGMAPDGSQINVKDIYSATVITGVKEDLGLTANIDQIRSGCSVEAIVSEDEERRKNAVLDDGEEYTEVPTVYRVKFQAGKGASKEYVRNVLDSVIDNYYIFYSQKYIDSSVIPNNSLNISADKYDYINCVEILQNSINDIMNYLYTKEALYSDFRSAQTGYSFSDLRSKYEYIKRNKISEYYAVVVGGKLTKDKDELVKTYQNRRDKDNIEIANLAEHINEEKAIIDQYGDKITKSDTSVAGAIGDNTDAIIEDVEEYWKDRDLDVDTTYDELIDYYVGLKSGKNKSEIDRGYCEEILAAFDNPGVGNTVDTPEVKAFLEDMDKTIAELNDLYAIVETTSLEMSECNAAKNIKSLSGVYAEETINVELYLIVAFILFFVFGCLGAVVLGRGADMWEYLVYVDKKTNLPNRVRCDMVIDEYAKSVLHDQFTCIVFRLNNLGRTNNKSGHSAGDDLLRKFGGFLRDYVADDGFVAYNNSNMFIGLFEDCTAERAAGLVERMQTHMKGEGEENYFDMSYGIAESSADDIYEIRSLLQKAIQRLNE